MKYNITINQKKAVEFGLKLDEVLLLTCIHDLIPISKFEKNDKHEVFITHSVFIEEYPLLNFKERTSFFKKFKKLEEDGYLTKSTVNLKGKKKKNYYGLTHKSDELFYSNANVEKNHNTNVEKNHNTNVEKNQHNNNNYNNIYYNNIINSMEKQKNDLSFLNALFLKFGKKIDCNSKAHYRYCNKIYNYLDKEEITEEGLIRYMLYKFQLYNEWGSEKVKIYFKPSTIFNNKFLSDYENAQIIEIDKEKFTYEDGKFITNDEKKKKELDEWINS